MHPSHLNSDVVKVAVVTQSLTSSQPNADLQKVIAISLIAISLMGYLLASAY